MVRIVEIIRGVYEFFVSVNDVVNVLIDFFNVMFNEYEIIYV